MVLRNVVKDVGPGKPNKPDDVYVVQNLLNGHAKVFAPLPPPRLNSRFDRTTARAIRRFQEVKFPGRYADGVVSRTGRTIRALNRLEDCYMPTLPGRYIYPAAAQMPMMRAIERFLGVTETGSNRMGADPRLQEIFTRDNHRHWYKDKKGKYQSTTDGYPWCCSLVTCCTQDVILSYPKMYGHLSWPSTAAVMTYLNVWATRNECLIFPPNHAIYKPAPGDIFTMRTVSHIGVVTRASPLEDYVETIEGNTNIKGSRDGGKCMRHRRKLSVLKAFVRFPVSPTATEYLDWGPGDPQRLKGIFKDAQMASLEKKLAAELSAPMDAMIKGTVSRVLR
ncbi:MAG: hypothetical protein AAF577_04060 [Pseudomonadota bacterium]